MELLTTVSVEIAGDTFTQFSPFYLLLIIFIGWQYENEEGSLAEACRIQSAISACDLVAQ